MTTKQTATQRREQALLDLNGQSLQMAVLHQPQPHDLDIRVSRQDDLFYDDTEVRKVKCSSDTEVLASLKALRATGFAAWVDYTSADKLQGLKLDMLTIKYVPLRDDTESLGDVLPESIWNAEYQEVAF